MVVTKLQNHPVQFKMKSLLTSIIVIFSLLTIFSLNVNARDDDSIPPIHYERVTPTILKLSNFKESYYINLSSGIGFSANMPPNQEAYSKICYQFRFENNNNWNVRCTDEFPFTSIGIKTDNQTYVNVTFSRAIIVGSGNATFEINYHLKNDDFKLYIDSIVRNNMRGGFRIVPAFSWILENISIGEPLNDLLLLNHSTYVLNQPLGLLFSNIDEDGYTIIDSKTNDYIHFSWNALKNHSIHVNSTNRFQNAPINVTIYENSIPSGSNLIFSFNYYDPAGACTSISDIINGSQGCFGNQYSVSATQTQALVSSSTTKLAFRFNATEDMYCDALSVRFSAVSGVENLRYGIQYDGAGSRANNTWINGTSNTQDFLTGVKTGEIGNLSDGNAITLSGNQIYHVVLDATDFGAGSKTVIFPQPQIFKLPYDYSAQPNMLVAVYSSAASKWTTQTSASPLFQLRCNSSVNGVIGSRIDNPIGWTYDTVNSSALVTGGGSPTARLQTFRVPYKLNVFGLGLSVAGDPSFPGFLDNLSFVVRRMDDKTVIGGGQATHNQSFFNDSDSAVFKWIDTNFSDYGIKNMTLYPNLNYSIMFFCDACNGVDGEYLLERQTETTGHVMGTNSSWNGLFALFTTTTNGTTITTFFTGRADIVFRLKVDRKFDNVIASSNNYYECADNLTFNNIINLPNNNITINGSIGSISFNQNYTIDVIKYINPYCRTILLGNTTKFVRRERK